jgi:hypothetical protein
VDSRTKTIFKISHPKAETKLLYIVLKKKGKNEVSQKLGYDSDKVDDYDLRAKGARRKIQNGSIEAGEEKK